MATPVSNRRAWDAATTVGEAVEGARGYASYLRGEFADEQREGASKWMTYGGADGFPDDFCVEQATLCSRTADNAVRHANAWDKWADAAARLFKPGEPAGNAKRELRFVVED